MLDEMPPGLLDQWAAYSQSEPFGQDWLRTAFTSQAVGVLSALVQAAFGVKNPRWPKVSDFMPHAGPEEDEPPAKVQQQRLDREQAAMAGMAAQFQKR